MKCLILGVSLLLGYSQLAAQNWLTKAEVYDFEVGDEFHYEPLYWIDPPAGSRWQVTDKWTSLSADTLFYERQHNNYSSVFVPTPEPHVEYTFYNFTDTLVITNLSDLPQAFDFDPANYQEFGFYSDTLAYESDSFCDSLVNEYTFEAGDFEPEFWERGFAAGLGMIRSTYSNAGEGVAGGLGLVYFEKDGVGCGTPDTTVGLEEFDSPALQIRVYPNPVVDDITLDGLPGASTVSLHSTAGKTLHRWNVNGGTQSLEMPNLAPGIYAISVISGPSRWSEYIIFR